MVSYNTISDSFKNQRIFVTGGTGFMGKVFIERLLRTTEVEKIYLLIREKKNKKASERLREIFEDPVSGEMPNLKYKILMFFTSQLYNSIKFEKSLDFILSKVHFIEGDCSFLNLNLSPENRQFLIENASMIFHFAATVRFNEKFKKAIELNTRGTGEMLKLVKEINDLKLFCYISTSYCHLEEKILMEKYYPPPVDTKTIFEIIEKLSENETEAFFSKYLNEEIPNSYVFTKALAESLIVESQFPTLVCRPAIVSQAYMEPLVGWTDNFNNMTGLIVAGCMGIMRNLNCTGKNAINIVPVDIAISDIMVASYHFLQENM